MSNMLHMVLIMMVNSDKVRQAYSVGGSIINGYITKGKLIMSVGIILGLFLMLTKIVKKAIGLAIMVGALLLAYLYMSMNGVM